MKSKEEEGEEEEGQKGKSVIEKLRRRAVSVGHRSVVFRPPSTPTRITFFNPNNPNFASSSRKLAASFWEFNHYYDQDHEIPPPVAKMHRPPYSSGGGDPSNRRLRHGLGKTPIRDNNSLDLTDDQPESAGSIRKQIGQMLMKHHQRNEPPLSPASSSLEVAQYNGAITPGSSLELHGRRRAAGEPNHNNLKTSTELLKVLNRIWTLEEQHSANISLIKALKSELSHSRARIKELLRCQQADRREMDEIVKQLAEEKLSKDTKERDRLSSAVQQIEEERKLRRRSESLQRKLAREVSEVKSTLSSCVEEMERGSKSRKLLERLCDEFARGIKSYEREVHGLKQKVDKSWEGWGKEDRVVLCIAETWLDERIQSGGEEGSVVEKMELEIEAFLESKQKNHRRSSLESAPFNAMSAPIQEVESEEEEGEDSNCFELKKHGSDAAKPPPLGDGGEKLDVMCSENQIRRRSQSPSSLQVKFEDQMAWAMSNNEKNKKKSGGVEGEKSEKERNNNNVVGEMIRTHRRLLSETQGIDEGSCSYLPPSSRRAESPIRHWNPRAMTSDLTTQGGVKDNTLKAKLSEARTKSSRPRIRLFKS